jgi:pre-mRNA-splicing factor SYF1
VVDSLAVLQQGTKRCRDRTLWTFHVDFLESLYYRKGRQFADDTKLVYQRMLDLGLITKQQVLNFVNLVEQLGGSFHDVFQILSKACNKIPWPARGELWIILLDKAIAFWVPEGRIERIREVYEDATKDTPPDCVMAIYKHWAAFEEQHGAPSKVVGKLCSAIRKLDNLDRQLEMVDFAVSKAKRLSGLTGARPVFELALKDLALTDEALMSLSLEFAGLEAALGDILRARAIFTHCAQSCRVYPGDSSPLWAHWADFEQRYGDEQTMRDMLRLKRQLQKRAQQDPFFVKASQS